MALTAFNGLVDEFLNNMIRLFEQRGETETVENAKGVQEALREFMHAKEKTKNRVPLTAIMDALKDSQEAIRNREDSVITETVAEISILQPMNIAQHWPTFNKKQQEGVWAFIDQIVFLGSSLLQVPPHMLNMIDGAMKPMMEMLQKQMAQDSQEQGQLE